MEYLSNDHKEHPDPHKNSYKLYNEKGHTFLSLKKSQWKLTQEHDQNFLIQGKLLQNTHKK